MAAPGAPAAAGNDKTTLFGVLGIILGLCCWPAGLVFAILSMNQAKRYGKQPTLAYVAFAIIALSLILNIVGLSQGWFTG
jgi:hypothetical protein